MEADITANTPEVVDIFQLTETPVTLTYAALGGAPITFYLRPWLLKDDEDARQAFFALTDDEQEKQRATHNVELLARLSVRPPTGLPNFTGDIRSYFGDGNPMKERVVADALRRYNLIVQPEEFFRRF